MTNLTVDELKKIMCRCAGDAGGDVMDGDITDIGFDELGYDSLALLETAAHVQREYGVTLGEDGLAGVTTPGEFVRFVNTMIDGAT